VRRRALRFRELLRIRIAVEGHAVEEATRHIRMDDVDRMEALNREFAAEMQRRQAEGVKLFRINKDIHFILYEAAGMPMLLPVIEGLWLQVGPVLHLSLRQRASANARGRNPAPNWHKRLILGLRKRDAPAARRALVGDMQSAVLKRLYDVVHKVFVLAAIKLAAIKRPIEAVAEVTGGFLEAVKHLSSRGSVQCRVGSWHPYPVNRIRACQLIEVCLYLVPA
jgi:hypothetical protein